MFVCQQSFHDRDGNKSFQASKPKTLFQTKERQKKYYKPVLCCFIPSTLLP